MTLQHMRGRIMVDEAKKMRYNRIDRGSISVPRSGRSSERSQHVGGGSRGYSEKLGLEFLSTGNGTRFSDGVFYNIVETRKAKLCLPTTLKTVHEVKKIFDGEIL